jgi:hypothetical protein
VVKVFSGYMPELAAFEASALFEKWIVANFVPKNPSVLVIGLI